MDEYEDFYVTWKTEQGWDIQVTGGRALMH